MRSHKAHSWNRSSIGLVLLTSALGCTGNVQDDSLSASSEYAKGGVKGGDMAELVVTPSPAVAYQDEVEIAGCGMNADEPTDVVIQKPSGPQSLATATDASGCLTATWLVQEAGSYAVEAYQVRGKHNTVQVAAGSFEVIEPMASCGDGTCDSGEDCSSCAADCGACGPVCGDAVCDSGEDCSSCESDCGACGPVCGDAVCDSGEDCSSCAADCGACGPVCGDNVCDSGEDCSSCASDCGACGPVCGDAVCDSGEGCSSCASDCGVCTTTSAGTIDGVVFEDLNRDGVQQAGEPGWVDNYVLLYRYNEDGTRTHLGGSWTDQNGRYAISGLADGQYRVELSHVVWGDIRDTWTPTTTPGHYKPVQDVTISGSGARFDIGLREIIFSTEYGAPLSQATFPSGMTVNVYVDVFTAEQIYDRLLQGSLIGEEAQFVTVFFGLDDTSRCSTSISGQPGSYSNYSARIFAGWKSWVSRPDDALFHEYGHAWANYYDKIYQQDGDFESYLAFRGLTGHPELDTSHAWSRGEMIAEDYRQLFGSPEGAYYYQENNEIPLAKDVPGLREFLRDTFRSYPRP